MALGVTLQLPTADRYSYDREHLLNNIAILLGGRAAEEIALQHMTTGAGNDLERATTLARKMVCEWGMSDSMGPLSYGKKEEAIFLGREIAQHRDYSENTAIEIDKEVKRIVMDNYHRARALIQEREPVLHNLAKALLEKETLDATDIDAIINLQPAAA
jgi:cell division protease FtsH